MVTGQGFLKDVERFLKRADMAATTFGRVALGDPRFVHDLREGRSPSLDTVERVYAFMRQQKASAA